MNAGLPACPSFQLICIYYYYTNEQVIQVHVTTAVQKAFLRSIAGCNVYGIGTGP